MVKKSQSIKVSVNFKSSKPSGSSDDDNFQFGWEGLSVEPLIYEARAIVDNAWPNTPTPDVVAGVWDETPIMKAVIVALRRGIEIGEGDPIATA